ncbi:MAG TPA: hypothetical protein VLQ79_11005, partial [Myxococcaceae bacterium]|nr:hypothetical protein [Myxococcaceae bacterium]
WAGEPPPGEFWPEVLRVVRGRHPEMLFIAEAYWDLEWQLQQQGFDFCYDKRLYDRLVHEDARSVRGHLSAGLDYQGKLVRFTENHDEPRAATALPGDRALAAAAVIATVPGATLWHDGQFEGRRVQLPVFLGRRPDEPVEADRLAFHLRLLAALAENHVRDGDWALLGTTGWPDNASHENLLAWTWSRPDVGHVVVVNLSDAPAQARIPLPWPDLAHRTVTLTDLLKRQRFDRVGTELVDPGLFVDLPAYGMHLFGVPLLPWEPPPS